MEVSYGKNPSSLLNCYKRLLKVRKDNISLQEGKLEFVEIDNPKLKSIAFRRIHDVQELFIYLNFSKKEFLIKTPKENPLLIFSTLSNRKALDPEAYNGNLKLTPFEGIIFK